MLDFLEEFAVVAEEAVDAFFDDECLENADGQMSFADADGTGKQEAAPFCGDGVVRRRIAAPSGVRRS